MMRSRAGPRRSTGDVVRVVDWVRDVPGRLSEDGLTFLFPCIEGIHGSGNKPIVWQIRVRIFSNEDDAREDVDPLVITEDIATGKDLRADYVASIRAFLRVGNGAISGTAPTIIARGKNEGRANATNPYCQALRDALGRYNKRARTRASASADAQAQTRPPVMLASSLHTTNIDPHLAQGIFFVQRKYNGVRAIGTVDAGAPVLYSRGQLTYEGFPQLREEIARVCDAWTNGDACKREFGIAQHGTLYLDGELYKHGASLQEISGIVRRTADVDAQNELNFVVYDAFIVETHAQESSDLYFSNRYAIMRAIERSEIGASLRKIQFAETFASEPANAPASELADAPARAMKARAIALAKDMILARARPLYEQFLREGYEGAIVRLNAPYDHNHNGSHSRFLLKIKPTEDAEYEIVGFRADGRGKADGAMMFVCRTDDGNEFAITPMGTIESRVQMSREFARVEENGRTVFENNWKGRMLIVYFDEQSRDGVPQRARTKCELRICE